MTHCDLVSRRNTDKLIEITKKILSEFGLNSDLGTSEWEKNDFVERLNLLQPNIIPLAEYINIDTSIRIKCKVCGYIWSTQPYHLVAKHNRTGCPKCANKARRTHDDFVKEIAKLLPTIKIIGTYVSRHKPIVVQCSACGKTWQAYPGNLLRRSGCKSCKLKNTIQQRSRKIRCITTGEIFNTFREAAEKYSISSAICLCCKNDPKHKHAGGLEWEYIIFSDTLWSWSNRFSSGEALLLDIMVTLLRWF